MVVRRWDVRGTRVRLCSESGLDHVRDRPRDRDFCQKNRGAWTTQLLQLQLYYPPEALEPATASCRSVRSDMALEHRKAGKETTEDDG